MSYSILSLGNDTRKQAMSGLRSAADREEHLESTNKQLKTAKRTQTMGAIGTGAAIGTSIMPGIGTAIGAVGGLIIGELF
ncbi:bacteriocin [Photobacterium kishitanii]|uniref:Bacteriocin n=1 Tax=Photobacterium kishitanii TaxID=318456 RepID=A0A2T3KEP8_9GAMM|nr:bacteriocin [Photobacterium kishitanii]PSU23808.1 bacteriocin [Photobacterium kishitanii]PSU86651.1 bacteriocin [Photobacterium kishitanii]PSU89928.1 bacteriocin [Photobacterium kishitanii]PSU95733.1 bacteriocin [Photobacterium kishitanii]PSV11649.1 bacteriocin [Photobacterium kishitanii]